MVEQCIYNHYWYIDIIKYMHRTIITNNIHVTYTGIFTQICAYLGTLLISTISTTAHL